MKSQENSRIYSVSRAVFSSSSSSSSSSLLTLLAIANISPRMVQCLANEDSERIRKEAGVVSGGTTPEVAWNASRIPQKPSVTVAEDAAQIRTMHL